MKYDNGTKQTWRGWAWNQIQSRITPRSKVLVLCGESGADIEHAQKRRFDIVGVDVEQSCVDRFRSMGGVAICDKVHRQLILQSPNGAILDMLGGITRQSWGDMVHSSSACEAVVWNGLRGRDGGGGFDSIMGDMPIPDYTTGRRRETITGKHRGKIAFAAIVARYWLAMHGRLADAMRGIVQGEHIPHSFFDDIGSAIRPAYYSYRSKDGGQWFDSIAWTNPRSQRGSLLSSEWGKLADSKRCNASNRKAAAAKAIITMRGKR